LNSSFGTRVLPKGVGVFHVPNGDLSQVLRRGTDFKTCLALCLFLL
jgi:hypothetical protein